MKKEKNTKVSHFMSDYEVAIGKNGIETSTFISTEDNVIYIYSCNNICNTYVFTEIGELTWEEFFKHYNYSFDNAKYFYKVCDIKVKVR